MGKSSCKGQVILELVFMVVFFLMLALYGHQQNTQSQKILNENRFAPSLKKEVKTYDRHK